MPSLVVHLALAGLLAAGLLGSAFDRRSLLVVLAGVVFADTDVFLGYVFHGAHRSAFHNLVLPLAVAGIAYYDVRVRDESWLRTQFGRTAPKVLGVAVVVFVFAGIGLDFVTGGANIFYPLHDQFYYLNGRFILSNQRGIVQTFLTLDQGGISAHTVGSTENVHMGSGFDPTAGRDPRRVERIFPVVGSGWQLLLLVTSTVVVGSRLWDER
jgi:hypothetical protein